MNVPLVRLGDVADVERDSVDPSAIAPGTAYVGLEHISGDGSFLNIPTVDPGDLASTKFRFSHRHVLFGKLRPYLRKIARPSFDGICSTDIVPILPSTRVDRDYLFHFLRTDTIVARATSLSAGINLPRINPRHLLDFEIPLPPIEQQRHIAAILDQADDLRRKRCLSLDSLDLLKRSLFVALLSTKTTSWPRVSVSDVALNIRTGPFGSQLLHSEFVDVGVAVLGIDNTINNEFSWLQRRYITEARYLELRRYRVLPGDVIVTIMGTCGRSAIVPPDIPRAINTKHLCCITLDTSRCLPEFLHASIVYDHNIRAQVGARERGAVMPGLNMQLIRDTKLTLPPIESQRTFATARAITDEIKAAQRAHLSKLDALFESLQHRAFSGELLMSHSLTPLAAV